MNMELPNVSKKEQIKTFEIEHLDGVDVVMNLDYQNVEDRNIVLDIIKNNPHLDKLLFMQPYIYIGPDSDRSRFYVKVKQDNLAQHHVDFILGRPVDDPIKGDFKKDFDTKARYGMAGVLNEVILSPKIRQLISSVEFQDLAKQFGFARMEFVEPIVAAADRTYRLKYLVYKNIKEIQISNSIWERFKLKSFANKLRNLFLKHGIIPHDLRKAQLLISEKDGKRQLYLVDIEAYTEK